TKKIDIIGQFGVGFYSAFMVSDKVTVISRAYGSDGAFKWESDGLDGYSVSPAQRENCGTDIIMHIKESTENENYDEFLEPYRIQSLVKQYSDYIRFPIVMDMEKSRLKEGSEDEYETVTEPTTLNSMVPLWKKNKRNVKPEEYNKFYKETFHDYEDPVKVIHQNAEGLVAYQAMLFIPAKADYNYYSKNYEKGLQLYSSGVKIMDKCADLLPDCFNFVKGIVDSEDLSLNISREMLQQDRQLKAIANGLEKKIKKELLDMLSKEREDYEKVWKAFGLQIKYAIYSSYGAQRDLLEDLLMFVRASDSKLCTLKEYVNAMPESQKYIYYAAGETTEKLNLLPQAETVRNHGFDILYLTDDVDEFLMNILHEVEGKELRSISNGDLGLETESEKEEKKEKEESNKDLLDFMKESLGDKVTDVIISSRLVSHPVCISSKGMLSIEMEKVLSQMPGNENMPKAERVLELNASHPVFEKLTSIWKADDKDKIKLYSEILYNQALLIEGVSIPDPLQFSNDICKLME
nr:molecular chaperone HtpG [Clostridiales bacterium]